MSRENSPQASSSAAIISFNSPPPKSHQRDALAQLLINFQEGDLLFGVQTDRAPLLNELGPIAIYKTVDEINKDLLAGNLPNPSNINDRNRTFIEEYTQKFLSNEFQKLDKSIDQLDNENRIRRICQFAVQWVWTERPNKSGHIRTAI